MAKSISVNKKSRGRPKKAGGVDPVSAVRLPMDLTEQVDLWGEGQKLSRSEAIRRLVELGLTLKTKGHQSKEGQKKRARELAGTAIGDMMDSATSRG